MNRTTFDIPRMDCASEEQMVRMKLEGFGNIAALEFDLLNRSLDVYHTGDPQPISAALGALNLGSTIAETAEAGRVPDDPSHRDQRKLLWQVLGINFFFFVLEMATGIISGSMGLIADGLDMLADSFVYGLGLFAVGHTLARKKGIARATGYLQLLLAISGLAEAGRRFIVAEEAPEFGLMISISILALIGNSLSLYLMAKSRSRDVHIRATTICTSNDVIMNAGVIAAGILVYFSDSRFPDLIVGSIVFLIVARGAFRILSISR